MYSIDRGKSPCGGNRLSQGRYLPLSSERKHGLTEVHDSIEGVSRGSMRVVMYIFFKYIHAIGTRWMLDSLIAQIVVSSLELEGRRRRTRELGGRVALCASLFALLLPELGSGMTTACRVDAGFTLSIYLRQISRPDVWDIEIFLYRYEKMNTERCA
jgi:hypothetical protein